jgi:hypothetical protein
MILYHLTRVSSLSYILEKGLLPARCYEWVGLYDGTVPVETPIIWFTDTIRPLGSYMHSSKCLVQVDSNTFDNKKLYSIKHPDVKGWWIYAGSIKKVSLVPWELYRKRKPKWLKRMICIKMIV